MPEKLHFRRADGGEEADAEVAVESEVTAEGDPVPPAGEYLTARHVELGGQWLRIHRVAVPPGALRAEAYDRLDNEILAGRRLHEVTGYGSYPAEVARLYGDKSYSADPFTLFEPYSGQPVRAVAARLVDAERVAFQRGLLIGLCWLAAAGIAHRAVNPDTVRWDSKRKQVQITDFSKATVFGARRTPVPGSLDWVPREQRQGTAYGEVGPRDDVWAAARLIIYVHNQGAPFPGFDQLAQFGLEPLIAVFVAPEERPTTADLLKRFGGTGIAPSAAGSQRLNDEWRRFWEVRERRHPDAPVPPAVKARLAAPAAAAVPPLSSPSPPVPPPGRDAAPPQASPPQDPGRRRGWLQRDKG